ncbi:cysteine hydrolase family protein [Methanolobus vulcani]|nr:isochorismatase family protein [Methanolobus vulcani]
MDEKHMKKTIIVTLLFVCITNLFACGCITNHDTNVKVVSDDLHTSESSIVQNREITLLTRTFVPCGFDANKTEMNSTYNYSYLTIDMDKTALLLIDLWACPNDTRLDTNVKTKMVPLLEFARKENMTIVHSPHDYTMNEYCQPLDGEMVAGRDNGLRNTDSFDEYLQAHNITNLLYAGYRSNYCILHRPTGIIKMSELGYNVILIRDCTIAYETPETLEGEWANKVSINMVESQFGSTTTLNDLQKAFGYDNFTYAAS